MAKSADYWQERFEQLEEAAYSYGEAAYREIEPAFDKAQREIQREIEAWYGRLAKNNSVTMQEARMLLSKSELDEFKWDVYEYIKYGQENAIDSRWMKELENASAKFHINRLEALKIRTQQAAEVAFGNELDAIDGMARKVFFESYYHTIYEVQKAFNIGWEIGQIDERKLNKIISKPWAADGRNFSDRIWQSKAQLIDELHTQLTRNCILGKGPDDAIKAISSKFGVSKSQAGRLVMTEEAFFHSAAQKEAFNELDVEEYKIIGTLDNVTCGVCGDMDSKILKMSDYQEGSTAPPFHPNCRCCTAPYFADMEGLGKRAAKNADGKTYYVSSDMKYNEWKKSFVDNNEISLQKENSNDIIKENQPVVYLQFQSGDEVNKYFGGSGGLLERKNSVEGKWKSSLTRDERDAIGWYTADGYGDINSYWRKYGDWQYIDSDLVKEATKDLESAISKFELQDNISVYRAIQPEAFGGLDVNFTKLIGSQYTDAGFMSTSPAYESTAVNKDLIMQIDVPKGKGNGAYINSLAGQYKDTEYEFLLPRNTKCEIYAVDEIDGKPLIKMRVIK